MQQVCAVRHSRQRRPDRVRERVAERTRPADGGQKEEAAKADTPQRPLQDGKRVLVAP